MRILLSNDDGIHAPGIQSLAVALRQFAHVQIVAPDRNRSGASNSLTLDVPLRIFHEANGDISVQSGTPTDCVYLGVNTLMRPMPEIVVAGINTGPNLGDDVIYSGTVAAAMEGRHLGFPALAISLDGDRHYDTAAVVACRLIRALVKEPLRTGKILNVNVPDLPLSELKGIRVTRCGSRHPAKEAIAQTDPRGHEMFWIGPPGETSDNAPDTDFAAIEQGFVSITPLQVDLTAYSAQSVLTSWLAKAEVSGKW
jgi:5'-nucleotidase